MRYIYIGLIVILTAIVVLFQFQNLNAVTITLFTFQITMPASLLVFVVYALGMVTGGAFLSLLRTWINRATRKPH
jgi:uncharacterized integral membrane protein